MTTNFLVDHNAVTRTLASVVGRSDDVDGTGTRTEQLQVALAMIDEIAVYLRQRGTPFLLALMPELIELQEAGRAHFYRETVAIFERFCSDRGIPFVDLFASFRHSDVQPVELLYIRDQWQHFSEAGNRLVAHEVNAALAQRFPGYPGR